MRRPHQCSPAVGILLVDAAPSGACLQCVEHLTWLGVEAETGRRGRFGNRWGAIAQLLSSLGLLARRLQQHPRAHEIRRAAEE